MIKIEDAIFLPAPEIKRVLSTELESVFEEICEIVISTRTPITEVIKQNWPRYKFILEKDIDLLCQNGLRDLVGRRMTPNRVGERLVQNQTPQPIKIKMTMNQPHDVIEPVKIRFFMEREMIYRAADGKPKSVIKFTIEDWDHFITRQNNVITGAKFRIKGAMTTKALLATYHVQTAEELPEEIKITLDDQWRRIKLDNPFLGEID